MLMITCVADSIKVSADEDISNVFVKIVSPEKWHGCQPKENGNLLDCTATAPILHFTWDIIFTQKSYCHWKRFSLWYTQDFLDPDIPLIKVLSILLYLFFKLIPAE